MAKTFAALFGALYVLMGVLAFLNTPIVGSDGIVTANAVAGLAYAVIGAVLLWGAFYATAATKRINTTMGAILALLAVIGFFVVADGGTFLGMAMSAVSNWLNLIAGVALLGAGLMQESTLRRLSHA